MPHPHDILLDNRPLVQIARHKVRRSPYDLDAAVVGLMVGFRAFERGQEGVVDIYYPAGHCGAEARGEDLHVAGEDDEVDFVLGDEGEDLGFLLGFCVGGDGEVVEGDVVGCGQRGVVSVVRDDEGHGDGELRDGLAEEEVVEAVPDFGDHD